MNCPIHKTKMDAKDLAFISAKTLYTCLECQLSWVVDPTTIENPKPELVKLLKKIRLEDKKEEQMKLLNRWDEILSKEKDISFIVLKKNFKSFKGEINGSE